MVKLLGSLLILGGGLWARWSMVSVCRRELDTLSELTACLSEMAEEIRQARTPLPELLDRLGRGRGTEVTAFFSHVAGVVRQGGDAALAWRQAAEELPLCDEDRDVLTEAGRQLGGDETSVCKGISLVTSHLTRSLEEQRRSRGEREKRVTALCFSAAALLVILLL